MIWAVDLRASPASDLGLTRRGHHWVVSEAFVNTSSAAIVRYKSHTRLMGFASAQPILRPWPDMIRSKRTPDQNENNMTTSYTVASYVINRLKEVGIEHVFGVPGDYAFPFLDAIEAEPTIKWVGVCTELNAAYAADGYARIRGMSAIAGSCGVLEMGAAGGIAGAFAEEVPLLVISGFPSTDEIARRTFTHHSLRGRFDQFQSIMAPITASQTMLTATDACEQIDDAIKRCWALKTPVYIQFPRDIQELAAATPISPLELAEPQSDRATLERFLSRALQMLRSADVNAGRNPQFFAGTAAAD